MTAEALHAACDALVQRTRVHVEGAWHTLPSLLEQLAGADAALGGFAGSAAAASKPPINTGVVALLREIDRTTRRQLLDVGGQARADLPGNARAATAATISTNDPAELDAWLYVLLRWHGAVRRELRLDVGRRQWLRGLPCPACGAVMARALDGDGYGMQTPALAVSWEPPAAGYEHVETEWQCSGVSCRACGQRWPRGMLYELSANVSQAT